ncbi:putative uncharacterized protein [Clostridium sp. CAG:1013]|nr:putative uncharacterized protein [Clostridium sp. CAG:1013]
MNWILCEILDEKGQVLAQSGQGGAASLILPCGGRSVVLKCGKPGSYCVIQLEDTLAPALVYLPQGKAVYQLPQGEERQGVSPTGGRTAGVLSPGVFPGDKRGAGQTGPAL